MSWQVLVTIKRVYQSLILHFFVGNICRSPIAEAVFLHLLKERGISHEWKVDSAGLGGWHSGNRPDSRARAVLAKYKIDYNNTARQVNKVARFFFGDFWIVDRNRGLCRV